MEATPRARSIARAEIVAGFAVAASGIIVTAVWWLALGGIRLSSNTDVQEFTLMFAYLASVAVWWFLTQIVMDDVTHPQLVRRALACLIVEEILLGIGPLAFVTDYRGTTLTWPLAGDSLAGLGALISAFGFVMMRRTYHESYGVAPLVDEESTN